MSGKLFVISAPSGTGKTTLVHEILARFAGSVSLERVITYTTKEISPSERQGYDYHFISTQEFLQKVQEGFFLEWSAAYGAYYGSPRFILSDLKAGKSFIIILDMAGAQAVRSYVPDAVLIWIYPESLDVLKKRLMARARDEAGEIERRLLLAQKELADEKNNQFFNWHVLNDDFDKAMFLIDSIVRNALKIDAEKPDQIS